MEKRELHTPGLDREKYRYNKLLWGGITVIGLFAFQVFAGRTGWAVADLLPYQGFDFYEIYGRISVHHIVQMIIASAVIFVLGKLLRLDFAFKAGDSKKGMKYVIVFTAVFAVISLITHILMYINDQLPTYDFPLNMSNIAGTLGIIQGKAYQESHSVLYPMLMHSISNVFMVGCGYLFILFGRM